VSTLDCGDSSHELVIIVFVVVTILVPFLAFTFAIAISIPSTHAIGAEDVFVDVHDEVEEIEESEDSDVEESVWVILEHIPDVVNEIERGLSVSHVEYGGVGQIGLAPCEHLGKHEHGWSTHGSAESDPCVPHLIHLGHLWVNTFWVWYDLSHENWSDNHPEGSQKDAWAEKGEPAQVIPGVDKSDLPLHLVVPVVLVVAGSVQALAKHASHLAFFATAALAAFLFIIVHVIIRVHIVIFLWNLVLILHDGKVIMKLSSFSQGIEQHVLKRLNDGRCIVSIVKHFIL